MQALNAGPSALDTPLLVTFFADRFAKTKEASEISLRQLVDWLTTTSAKTKAELPWLKLAEFGDRRSEGNSLRHDDNVHAIFGIEADYDGETITLDRARQVLLQAGLAAVLYTSPSHTAGKPRWRILCPTSAPLSPASRAGLVARVNGLFVGALASESFTMSQAYYFGFIEGNGDHAVVPIDGKPIDHACELDEGAVGRQATREPVQAPLGPRPYRPTPTDGGSPYGLTALQRECGAIRGAPDGAKHATVNRAAYAIGGLVPEQLQEGVALAELNEALESIRGRCKDFRAAQRTLQDGFRAGLADPRTVPDRPMLLEEGTNHAADILAAHERQKAAAEEDPPEDFGEAFRQKAIAAGWSDPVDFFGDTSMTGEPELKPEHLPEAIAPFVFDTAERMGVDPAAVALAALVSLASIMDDAWTIQPKQFDSTWTENPRLWGAIVGDPSILKTPILKAVTRPLDALETEAARTYHDAVRSWKVRHKTWKDEGSNPQTEPRHPKRARYMVESTTTEALSEVLRDDADAHQVAPAGKVLVRQDEMAEWLAGFDRYNGASKGGADRGAYLRLYNGGRYTIDRVNRGQFPIPNWSACVLGGIQPGPIQRIARDAADDGLLQRFCYCVPGRQGRGEDRMPNAEAIARFEALFPALTALHPPKADHEGTVPVVLHADARQHRMDILDLAEAIASMPDTSGRLKSAMGKWPGLFPRLVLVFHLVEVADARVRGNVVNVSTPPLTVATAATAARAAAYMRDILLPHLLRTETVMFATEQTGHAKWIAGYILARGETRVAARDIMRHYQALRPPERAKDLQQVMDTLETMGWIHPEPSSNRSKPPTAWAVNPLVHANFSTHAQIERERRDEIKAQIRESVARARKAQTS